jgi:hypothetical protein
VRIDVICRKVRGCVEVEPEIGWPIGRHGNHDDLGILSELVEGKLVALQVGAEERLGDGGAKGGGERFDAVGVAGLLEHYGGGGGMGLQARGQPPQGRRCDVGHVDGENEDFVRRGVFKSGENAAEGALVGDGVGGFVGEEAVAGGMLAPGGGN